MIRAKSSKDRGQAFDHHDGGRIVFADNTVPQDVFQWAVGGVTGNDIQFKHVYSASADVTLYTSLANLCVTPSFLAKLTDHDEAICALLEYRVYDLYGFIPPQHKPPEKPKIYSELEWREPCPVIGDLEGLYRKGMKRGPKNHATICAREVGWLFSDFRPDLCV